MIAVDTNLLVYAHRVDLTVNAAAVACLKPLIESGSGWTIPWPCVHEFIGVVTNRRIYARPTPLSLALQQIEAWSQSNNFRFIGETFTHLDALRDIALPPGISGGQIHDARIAAICIQHGVDELWSADRDFSCYPKLKTRNPLFA